MQRAEANRDGSRRAGLTISIPVVRVQDEVLYPDSSLRQVAEPPDQAAPRVLQETDDPAVQILTSEVPVGEGVGEEVWIVGLGDGGVTSVYDRLQIS